MTELECASATAQLKVRRGAPLIGQDLNRPSLLPLSHLCR